MHPELAAALTTLHVEAGRPREGPVICSERQRHMAARSVVNWFRDTYARSFSHSPDRIPICGYDQDLVKFSFHLVSPCPSHVALRAWVKCHELQ